MAAAKSTSTTDLPAALADAFREAPAGPYCVGLSGGVDSVVLLHLALRCLLVGSVSALHVHHGLSPNANAWAQFCVDLCARLGVPLRIERVAVERAGGGLEEAARQARYRAYQAQLAPCVMLAHHADDQAETLLFNLLRGAGVQGAAAMPGERPLGAGHRLWRPLLAVSRAQIVAWAKAEGLSWIEDESNRDTGFARNFLRHDILPALQQRFPRATDKLAQAAALCGEAAQLLGQLAAADAATAMTLAGFQQLDAARQRNLLRYCLQQAGLPMPGQARLEEARRQLAAATGDAVFAVAVGGAAFGLWRGRIDCHRVWQGVQEPCRWHEQTRLAWCGGELAAVAGSGQGVARTRLAAAGHHAITLRCRLGGECLQLAANRPHRPLGKLFQEAGVAPWLRDRLPLLYAGDELVWVAGVGVAAGWRCAPGEAGVAFSWLP